MASRTRNEPITSMQPIDARDFGYDEARHLLLRAGFGGSPEQIQTLAGWGPERAVDHLLEIERIDYRDPEDSEFAPDLIGEPGARETAMLRRARREQDEETLARLRALRQKMERDDRQQLARMQRWWLRRMIESPRPLEEKMTLFWHGHFAASHRKVENSWHMLLQNNAFRAQAVGDYGALLGYIIRDPAMLRYLDNDRSRVGAPNENLARELMELFSLGVGNYSERDIKEGARALTGYTFNDNGFVFNEDQHDRGAKRILGAQGDLDGEGFVRAILAQRECSDFIARKLYRYFVRTDISMDEREAPRWQQTVNRRLASTLRSSDYNVRPMLRELFLSRHFYDPQNRMCMVKSPAELIAGAARSLLTPARDLAILTDAMDRMGQDLFRPPSVAGWTGGRSWINTSTLYVRQNTLVFMLTGALPQGGSRVGVDYDPTPLLHPLAEAEPGAESDPARVVDWLLRLALGEATAQRRDPLVSFVSERGGRITPPIITGLLTLISAAPEHQLC